MSQEGMHRGPLLTAVSAAEALAMDVWLIEERGFRLEELMRAAGAALGETAREFHESWGTEEIVFLVGPGNNGGDALIARERLGGVAAGPVWRPLAGDPAPALSASTLVVDGLFGVGLARAVDGVAAEALEAVVASGAQVLAVDVPSGLDATSGEVLGVALPARATLSFVLPKLGFFRARGPELVGSWSTAEIGFPAAEAEAWVRARRAASPPSEEDGPAG